MIVIGTILLALACWAAPCLAAQSWLRVASLEAVPTQPAVNMTKSQLLDAMSTNWLSYYAQHIAQAADDGVQLIVLPEQGLGFPNSRHDGMLVGANLSAVGLGMSLCGHVSPAMPVWLSQIGCTAREHHMAIALSVPEVAAGDEVGAVWLFNTQILVDYQGRLVQFYRKNHLYEDEAAVFNSPVLLWGYTTPTVAYLEVPGIARRVLIGMLVCMDLWYPGPMAAIAEQADLVVFSTYWNSVPWSPEITAQALQRAMAAQYNTTLVASNVGYSYRHSGSGIWSGDECLASAFNDGTTPQTTLLQSAVPLKDTASAATAPGAALPSATTAMSTSGGMPEPQVIRVHVLPGQCASAQVSAATSEFPAATQCSVTACMAASEPAQAWDLVAVRGLYMPGTLNASMCVFQQVVLGGDSGLPLPLATGAVFDSIQVTGSAWAARRPVLSIATGANGAVQGLQDLPSATCNADTATCTAQLQQHATHALTVFGIYQAPAPLPAQPHASQ